MSVLSRDNGAENWAIVASRIESCKLNGIDSQAYRRRTHPRRQSRAKLAAGRTSALDLGRRSRSTARRLIDPLRHPAKVKLLSKVCGNHDYARRKPRSSELSGKSISRPGDSFVICLGFNRENCAATVN